MGSLTFRPKEGEPNISQVSERKSAKAKYIIIVTMDDSFMAKARDIVQDEAKEAKEVWENICLIYTTSNHQAMNNLINGLDLIVFDEKREMWDKFSYKFMIIIDEFGSYDQEITDERRRQTSKLFRNPSNRSPWYATLRRCRSTTSSTKWTPRTSGNTHRSW